MLCILYCAAILICVVVKLRQAFYQLVDTNIGGKTMTSQYEKNVLKKKAVISSTNSVVNNETKNVGNEEKTQQPSFAEKLRYNFLILIFKKPKESDAIINDDPYYFDYNNNDEIRTNITDGTVDLEKIM